ncbi:MULTISPECIES: hypothetical protein [unclassified Bradyrhizobium]|uniref:hypothetical protein n=1 Tax=unclassified Bradyrhizobium TaxID=2631580 RepID=UPI002FF0EE87
MIGAVAASWELLQWTTVAPLRAPALVEPLASANDLLTRGKINPVEAAVSQWRDSMVDRPETDGAAYLTGWTISGLAVLGTIVAIWALGI